MDQSILNLLNMQSETSDMEKIYSPAKRKHDDTDNDNNGSENEYQSRWKLESENETDIECKIWDEETITVPRYSRENKLVGYNLGKGIHPTIDPEPNSTLKQIKLNEEIVTDSFRLKFSEAWNNNTDLKINGVDFTNDPFKFCSVENFIENANFLDKIKLEINNLEWNRRSMDLYDFFQSHDLKYIASFYIKNIYECLKTEVMHWMSTITGIKLVKMSATCSFYSDTDYLLVHDDLQEDRAIAFVLYMTDSIQKSSNELWKPEMGGALELFDKNEFGHPNKSVKKILPKNNRFIFFKVTNDSYHQVEEVLNMNHCRLSINGWFHTVEPNSYVAPKLETPTLGLFSNNYVDPIGSKELLCNWINSNYLDNNAKIEIQEQIEHHSEISLGAFLKEDKYEELCVALQNCDIVWEWTGFPNRRRYEIIKTDNIPSIIHELLSLFQSREMFALFKDYTDLDLVENENMHPKIKMELQRWTPGCYSLLSDYNWEAEKELDVILYLSCAPTIIGGQTMYLASEEKIEDVLITVEPHENTLNIVFRDTCRIVKHISKRSQNKCFYTLVCSYKE